MSLVGGQGAVGSAKRPGWKQNPEQVRRDILRVAREEFSANGLSGGRIAEIAARTKTSKRMIYYYFGDKEGLYRCVLEEAYRETREGELDLDVDGLPAVEALKKLVEFTFDHHQNNPDLVRLIMIENIHHGRYLSGSEVIEDLNRTAIGKLAKICRRARREGVFRRGVTPLQLHWQISALCFFNISNQATFTLLFGEKLHKPVAQNRLRSDVVDMVIRFVLEPSEIARFI